MKTDMSTVKGTSVSHKICGPTAAKLQSNSIECDAV